MKLQGPSWIMVCGPCRRSCSIMCAHHSGFSTASKCLCQCSSSNYDVTGKEGRMVLAGPGFLSTAAPTEEHWSGCAWAVLCLSRWHSSPEVCEPGCQGAQQSDGKQEDSYRTGPKGRRGRWLLTRQKVQGSVRKGDKSPATHNEKPPGCLKGTGVAARAASRRPRDHW